MWGLRRRNRTKVFNPPYFKSTIFVKDMVFEEIDQLKTISKICTGVVIVHTPWVTMQLKSKPHLKEIRTSESATHEKEFHKWTKITRICFIFCQTKDTPFVHLPGTLRVGLNLSGKQPYCFRSFWMDNFRGWI